MMTAIKLPSGQTLTVAPYGTRVRITCTIAGFVPISRTLLIGTTHGLIGAAQMARMHGETAALTLADGESIEIGRADGLYVEFKTRFGRWRFGLTADMLEALENALDFAVEAAMVAAERGQLYPKAA